MNERSREKYLKVALVVIGLAFLAIYPLMVFWPAGWQWQPSHPEYEQMIIGVYATLGLFLLVASRRPKAASSLIRFTAWSSLVHAGIMTVQAVGDPQERGHFFGDIPALYIVFIVLFVLSPRSDESTRERRY